MNDEEILIKVKNLLGMGQNDYQDDVLLGYIEIVKNDMVESGVPSNVVNSNRAIGTIVRGTIDYWNYGSNADYSPMYVNSVVKLRAGNTTANNGGV